VAVDVIGNRVLHSAYFALFLLIVIPYTVSAHSPVTIQHRSGYLKCTSLGSTKSRDRF